MTIACDMCQGRKGRMETDYSLDGRRVEVWTPCAYCQTSDAAPHLIDGMTLSQLDYLHMEPSQ